MKQIIKQLSRYFYYIDKRILLASSVLTALLLFFNYHYKWDDHISLYPLFQRFIYRYSIFLTAFGIPYLLTILTSNRVKWKDPGFIILVLIAPAIFSMRMALKIPIQFSHDPSMNNYWNDVFYWPFRLLLLVLVLLIIWKWKDPDQPFYGMSVRNIKWKPYFLMLMIMLPLIALASTQADFLEMYPKLKSVVGSEVENHFPAGKALLFELSYGSDFLSIELFFRGFLVLAFLKWAGKDAILPMACFYCMIHFGKPLGECISSFPGGLILGVIVYHTRSIWGGLMVHLGIAWLMEAAGYFHPFVPG